MNDYPSSKDADHWRKQKRIEKILKSLRNNGFEPYFFSKEKAFSLSGIRHKKISKFWKMAEPLEVSKNLNEGSEGLAYL
jgi:hypothetical protein